MSKNIKEITSKIDAQLKNFQKASVEYVLQQLFEEGRRKVLIADEVGLGKTIIAKGVIAKAVERYAKKGKPFHVVYICSNQVLAQQNLGKLNLFKDNPNSLSRLIFLAKKTPPSNNSFITLSSLTPTTSFHLTQGTGTFEERAIIFWLLYQSKCFKEKASTLERFTRCSRSAENWKRDIAFIKKHGKAIIRSKLPTAFRKHLMEQPFCPNRFRNTASYLGNKDYKSLFSALKALIGKICKERKRNISDYSSEIIKALRSELTKVCIKYLEADLFILDEFQRFKSLLDGEDTSEAGAIAKKVLQNDAAKVLLLSATPFKPYTTQLEQLSGESHHHEFRKVVEFLGGDKGPALWAEFAEHQTAFFQILRHPESVMEDPDNADSKKKALEKVFKKFLSRNERMGGARKFDNMIRHVERDKIDVEKGDIENFMAIDQLVMKLTNLATHRKKHFGSTLNFSKSAPYTLSYLYGYKIRNVLNEYKEEEEIKKLLKVQKAAWLPYQRINNYETIDADGKGTFPNGKLRVLAKECFANQAERLLWVPASKPYYQPRGVYKKAKDFSKILIFSGWAMVPRALSTLLSYEVERRTIGSLDEQTNNRKEITYFGKRRLAPLLRYTVTEKESKTKYKMDNFVLSYPSLSLVLNSVYFDDFKFGRSYKELQQLQIKKLNELFVQHGLKSKYIKDVDVDDKWYWIAGPLLDKINGNFVGQAGSTFFTQNIQGSKKKHWDYLCKMVEDVFSGRLFLGEYPNDLFQVLADATLAAPANAVLHGFLKNYDKEIQEECFRNSIKIAGCYIDLFNKPESISVVKLCNKNKIQSYWRSVLNYCLEGNVAASVEEYLYLLKECEGKNQTEVTEAFEQVLKVHSTSIEVDLQEEDGEIISKSMRCHFAVNYGSQKMTTEGGKDRMVNVRTVFNSPFRPFVLTSTSIGQEGLDFHYYCRKIFHWNLPHNAIDLEQREGRINRYKGFVIRKKIAEIITDQEWEEYSGNCQGKSSWDILFDIAKERLSDDSGLQPFWYLDEGNTSIERFVPIHPMSKDKSKLDQLLITLGLYRLTFGQPRQEELIEAFKNSSLTAEQIKILRNKLLINLSPLNY